MGDIVQSASVILSGSQRRAEDAAHNIANLATPGYRARHGFEAAVASAAGAPPSSTQTIRLSFAAGSLSETGVATDLAIDGDGFFELRGPAGTFYSRNGQFTRDDAGRLVGPAGFVLQAAAGGDLIVEEADFTIAQDGTVTIADRIVGQVAIATFDAASAFAGPSGLIGAAPDAVSATAAPSLRQGFLESSNVAMGDEMVALMEAVRRAETGQRLVNVYDDLLGRVVTTLGQNS